MNPPRIKALDPVSPGRTITIGLFSVSSLMIVSAFTFCWSDEPAGFGAAATSASANEVADFKGTLKGFQRGVLQVTRDDGTEVMVQLPKTADKLTFIADAKPAFLQRGMLVRFSGTFAPNGAAAAPIEKIEVFQPLNLQGIPGHSRTRFLPGVHPADRRAPKKPVGLAKYTIVGQLMGLSAQGAITVQAGKIPVVAPLSKEATLEIRFNNLTLAQEGDAIKVAGFYDPPDDTQIRGDSITVTTDRVYGEPVKSVSRRGKHGAKRDAKPVEDKD